MLMLRSKISQYCTNAQNNTKKMEIQEPLGLSTKKQGPNPLKVNRKGPKPTNGQTLDLTKQRKKKFNPSLKGENRWGTQKEN